MIRLGLCCKFLGEPIRFRSTTATYLLKSPHPLAYVNTIVQHNIDSLKSAILYCQQHHIGSFRIGSDFLPVATHPKAGYTLDDLPDGALFKKALKACGKLANDAHIRLTFHPDQFVVLSSAKSDVVKKSLIDLEYHAYLADLVGADVINIHGGGAYNDKALALTRFKTHFQELSHEAKKRITIENDDRIYTPSDLLPLCDELNIPLVYDVHHHRCLPDSLTIEEATKAAQATWNREPLFHLSSPLEGWKGPRPERHHDYINPKDFPTCWEKIDPLTIEVEAKAKEKAVLRLHRALVKRGIL